MTLSLILFYLVLILFSLAYLVYPFLKSSSLNFFISSDDTTSNPDSENEFKVNKKNSGKKTKSEKIFFFLLGAAFIFTSSLSAADVVVKIQNLSTGGMASNIDSVKLLELSQSMQVLQEKNNVSNEASFAQADMKEGIPYMVQVLYKGTVYSYPFQKKENQTQTIDAQVYDVTDNFIFGLDYRKVIYVSYFTDGLLFRVITVFENTSKKVFSEKEGGVYLSAPPQILNVQAVVPMGGKQGTELNWLNLDTQPSKIKKGMYLLPQGVKPGFKFYQTDFLTEYNGENFSFPMQQEYPSREKVILKLDAKGMDVRIQEDPAWRAQILNSEEFGDYIELPARENITLVFSGGEPSQSNSSQQDDSAVHVDSPLTKTQKAGVIIFSLALIFSVFFYVTHKKENRSGGEESVVQDLKERNRLLQKLKQLEESNLSAQEKQEKIISLRVRIQVLEESINSHGLS